MRSHRFPISENFNKQMLLLFQKYIYNTAYSMSYNNKSMHYFIVFYTK